MWINWICWKFQWDCCGPIVGGPWNQPWKLLEYLFVVKDVCHPTWWFNLEPACWLPWRCTTSTHQRGLLWLVCELEPTILYIFYTYISIYIYIRTHFHIYIYTIFIFICCTGRGWWLSIEAFLFFLRKTLRATDPRKTSVNLDTEFSHVFSHQTCDPCRKLVLQCKFMC